MNNLRNKSVNISTFVENQLPFFVAQSNRKFVSFLSSYYESLETKFQPLDIISNLIDYYNIGSYFKSDLTESTMLDSNLYSTTGSTTITVESTIGFPEKNGYIKINDEIIFYETKTTTQFLNCHRGTAAFILERTSNSNVVFQSSAENPDYNASTDINKYTQSHEAGSLVYNLSYYFVEEFFRRIKFEIAPEIPEKLVDELNLINFLKNIKSFYSAKGSLNAHKILFRILFNDKKLKIRTVNRGYGAKLLVFNYTGKVDGIKVITGGQNYNPLSPPIIDITGSGTGSLTNNIIPKTASATAVVSNAGVITDVVVTDPGVGYIGPIGAKVRERSFTEDQIVTNASGTGRARVEYWDFNTNELFLYDVEGYFKIGDVITGQGGESPVTSIAESYPTTTENKEGNPSIEVLPLDPNIEYPKNYILKPSSSTYKNKKIIKCKCISNKSKFSNFDRIISLVQEKDVLNGIKGVTIESSEYNEGLNNTYEFNIDINSDHKNLYLPQSTVVTITKSNIASNTEFILTVDDAYGYPLENGYFYVNGVVVQYKSRSSNQFFGCIHKESSSITIKQTDEVFEYGIKKYNTQWTSSTKVNIGDIVYYESNAYEALNIGTTSTTPPTHTSGIKSEVLFGVKWKYIGKNIIKRSLIGYLDADLSETNAIEFILLGLVSELNIEEESSLYDDSILTFVPTPKNLNDDPLFNSFNENQTNIITNLLLNSANNTTGVHSTYDYNDHVYVTSSAIPPYLDSTNNSRKSVCTNQKLFKRIPKKYSVQKDTISASKTLKNIGITVDGIQIQSPVGNSIQYGLLKYIEIDTSGNYKAPVIVNQNQFDYTKYPVFIVNGDTTIKNTSLTTFVYIASKIVSVNLNNLDSSYLTGFKSRPTIKIINNNPNGNPVGYEDAVLDLSFNEKTGSIDNILIINPGNGYVSAPTIRIEGGGKTDTNLPLRTSSGYVFEFKGSLISSQNYSSTTNYNLIDVSGVVPTIYKSVPSIVVDAGSDANLKVYVTQGKLSGIEIINQGKNYYTTPTVEISHPTGVNGVILAENNETTGKIPSYTISSIGSNYTSVPSVRIIPSGSGGTAIAKLNVWTFNLVNNLTIDNYGGYIYNSADSNPNGGNVNQPVVLKDNLPKSNDNNEYLILSTTSSFNSYYSITSSVHSPIIGWAYDGNPIYGPYGYSNPMDKNSAITSMTSKWVLKSSRVGGPDASEYPLGTFIEDYDTTLTTSKLDQYNGRYCVTPEFPNGVYAYFSTLNQFPYIIGLEFFGKCDSFNICNDRLNDKVPQVLTRINNKTNSYFPKQYNSLSSTKVRLNASSGKVDSIIVESGGYGYSIGDKLIVDNSESGGLGFSAIVSKIEGKNILNYSFVTKSSINYVEFVTDTNHGLNNTDQVDIEYTKNSSFLDYSLIANTQINYYYNAKLLIASANTAKFYLDSNLTIPFFDDDIFKLYSTYIEVTTDKCPDKFYIVVGSTTYTVSLKKYSLNGSYSILVDYDHLDRFYIECPEDFTTLGITSIKYLTNSKNAIGGIAKCIVVNKGVGYKTLPKIIGVRSLTGDDAILQANSSSIGSIKSLTYSGFGDEFTSNRTVKYDINIPFTAKVINNFKISSINILNGGQDYSSNTDYILVDGQQNYPTYQFKLETQLGIITNIEVINGGYNLSRYPNITVYSLTGSNVQLHANLKRVDLTSGTLLTCGDGSVIKVLKYDASNSILTFEYVSGNDFEKIEENTTLTLPNNILYGNITSIKRARAYARNSSYSTIEPKFLDNKGFLSNSDQKLIDSNYYQDWSYTLSSSRNTSEWKSQVVKNTHAAGFKVFGKNIIEKKSTIFENYADVLSSSVIFKSNLDSKFNLKLGTPTCKTQYICINNTSNIAVKDYVYGNLSGAIGIVLSKVGENYLQVELLNNIEFQLLENLFVVTNDFINNSTSDIGYFYVFSNGLMQNPFQSYLISNQQIIPLFPATNESLPYYYNLTTQFVELVPTIDPTDNTKITLKSSDGSNFNPTSSQKLIISINGVVQNPSNYTVSSNVVSFNTAISSNSSIFVTHHTQLNAITFTGTGTVRTINYSTASTCKLLVFVNGVHQNSTSGDYALTNSTTLTFSENPGTEIFGWYVNENVSCSFVNNLQDSFIIDAKDCTIEIAKTLIESSSAKNPNYYYEFKKELLDGTVTSTVDTVYGYDSSFIKTYPEYSTSYAEVLNKIPFDGSTKTFTLKYYGNETYTPVNDKSNLIVYINNVMLDPDEYSISGSSITFNRLQAYASSDNCTIIDFNSKYLANNTLSKGANLDRLNVTQNGVRSTFNLSDKGIPQYVKNTGDVFTIKNNYLLRPDSQSQTVSGNKITLQSAPSSSDDIKLLYFNRQLSPLSTKNVLLDTFYAFNGVRDTWPITVQGTAFFPVSVYHIFVIRNGVYQKPGIDYTISGSSITFTTPPALTESITSYYACNNLDQNFAIDSFKQFDNSTKRFALTTSYVSSQVTSSSHLLVLKNNVYQHPTTDYTIGGGTNERYIDFTIAPNVSDTITVVNYKSTDLVNITNRFTQYNTTTLQYTSQSPVIDTNVLLVYVNGILQSGNWTFDTGTNRLIFNTFVSLTLDKVTIIAFQNQKRKFDTITKVSGTNTYSLKISNTTITTNLPSASDLVVSVNGTSNLPVTDYTVSGSSITIPTVPDGSSVYVYQIETQQTEVVDSFNDNYSKSTYKLLVNYGSFNPVETCDVLVLRNGVVQNPTVDFSIGNGYITFSTNITQNDEMFLMYCHANDYYTITNINGATITLSSSIPSNQYKDLILYVNGIAQFYNQNFTISGNIVTLSENITIDSIFAIKTPSMTTIDYFDDQPNSSRTLFRLYYNSQNLISSEIQSNADILVSVNNIIQYPGVQYTLTADRGAIIFTQPPSATDTIFMVKMSGNEIVNLTYAGTNDRYNLSQSISTLERQNLIVFGSRQWCSEEMQDFSYLNNTTINLNDTQIDVTSNLFAIKFQSIIKLLDETNTPFNGSRTKFNMFYNQENFMPVGTIENDLIPSESSILVVKNGKVLDPGIDYTLQGDIKTQIQFTVAPISTDVISIKSVGSFLKLSSITSGFGGKVYSLKKQDNSDYYPNKDIQRPREYENQILVIKNGDIQSPLYDYYIDNNKLVFTNNVTGSNKIVILDFRGTKSDVEVVSTSYEVSIGDKIQISGEPTSRKVTEVISPTVLKTESYVGATPTGFTASTTITDGKLTGIAITNPGSFYTYPPVIRTIGSGVSAKVVGSIDRINANGITQPLTIQFAGYNMYGATSNVATTYAYVYKKLPLDSSCVRLGTQLNASLSNSDEFITVKNTNIFKKNVPTISITSSTGNGATFRPYVSNGRIRKIDVISGGSGYNEKDVTINVTGGGGSGCVLEVSLNSSGSVTAATVKNGGEGYDTFKACILNELTNKLEIIEYTDTSSTQLLGCTRPSQSFAHASDTKIYYDDFI
jgi:hypothetical protein